ncbi:anthrone oxygenase family protein [Stieleria mannarensis]|uniref:anthrone oxygenase family protein n=1 Tax=Stieleria mannarensis TaxID=2755585 RepID=UPI001601CF43|nr:anthrone oxygenase family protein [Rhodopirellula sp. JC639]
MTTILMLLTVIAIAGSGLMAGLFFVFSVSVMNALAQMPAQEGMKAMQLINRTILNPLFLSAFFGTALACLLLAAISAWQRPPDFGWAIAGACLYLLGGFMVTAFFNVPLNNSLDKLSADDPASHAEWTRYLAIWTRWNHLRAAACILACVLLAIGLP